MVAYLVLFDEDIASETQDLIASYDFASYPVKDGVVLVATNIDDVSAIKQMLRFGGRDDEEERLGAVLKLNGSYAGYYYEGLWNWLKEAEGEQVGVSRV